MNRYPIASTPEQQNGPFMVESRVPVGESRLTTHVFVPALQALVTMFLIASVVMFWQWRPIAGVVGTIGLLVWGWRILLNDRLLWKLETITGRELDGTPGIGKPQPVTLLNRDAARTAAARHPAAQITEDSDQPRMLRFVTRCFTLGTSEDDQGIKPNTNEREDYVECRDALLTLGLAKWRNSGRPQSGWKMVVDHETAVELIKKHVD